jgi:hypothetical protein
VTEARLITIKEMSVNIDEPRCNELTRSIDSFTRFVGGYIFRDGCDYALLECDVAAAAQVLAGVDDFAAFQQ